MSLHAIIKQAIRDKGPISIAEYMELCLSHPVHGYYIKQDPFGARGDFITAPEVCQVFGELVGLWCADVWSQWGEGPMALVELGPGRGTLMQDALRATRMVESFHESTTVHLVETSPVLQTLQFAALQNAHDRVEWHESIDDLPQKPCIIIANEFFDALPIRQHVQTDEGMKERCVGIDEESGELCFVLQSKGLALAKGGSAIKSGTIIESCLAAKEIMHRLCEHIGHFGGAMLLIDYGYLGEGHQDTLQAVKGHLYHPPLKSPGDADLTAHVDFATLREVAEDYGMHVLGPADQGKFLVRLGLQARIEKLLQHASEEQAIQLITGSKRLIDPAQMGKLFKAMAVLADHQVQPAGFDAHHVSELG